MPMVFWNITPEQTDAYAPIIREFAAGIREADKGRHLITFKPDPAPCTSSFLHADTWLDFNCIQTWKDVNLIVPMVRHDYGLKPTKPVVMAEGAYEEGSEYGFPVTPLWVRRQAYYTYLLGSHHGYGHNDAWRILPTWKKSLAAPGALQMGILRKIFEAIAEWWLLVPDQELLAKGARDDGEILTLAARHERGRWAMVYLAEPGRCTVRMDRLAPAAVRAAWIDPRSGSAVEIGRLENRGAKEFVTPAGWEDALLVLEAPR